MKQFYLFLCVIFFYVTGCIKTPGKNESVASAEVLNTLPNNTKNAGFLVAGSSQMNLNQSKGVLDCANVDGQGAYYSTGEKFLDDALFQKIPYQTSTGVDISCVLSITQFSTNFSTYGGLTFTPYVANTALIITLDRQSHAAESWGTVAYVSGSTYIGLKSAADYVVGSGDIRTYSFTFQFSQINSGPSTGVVELKPAVSTVSTDYPDSPKVSAASILKMPNTTVNGAYDYSIQVLFSDGATPPAIMSTTDWANFYSSPYAAYGCLLFLSGTGASITIGSGSGAVTLEGQIKPANWNDAESLFTNSTSTTAISCNDLINYQQGNWGIGSSTTATQYYNYDWFAIFSNNIGQSGTVLGVNSYTILTISKP